MSDSLAIVAPMFCAVAAAVLTLLADAFASRKTAVALGVLGMFAAVGFALAHVLTVTEASAAYGVFIGGAGFAMPSVLIFGFGALAAFGGASSFTERSGGGAALALVALATAGAAALAQSLDFVVSLIALETIAVSAYGLVSGARTARSDEAAMKYVIQGAVATGLIVLGTAILVGLYGGGTSYEGLAQALQSAPVLPATAGAALVMAAYAYKLGAAPFHSWAPDAFETAPPSAGAFLATAPKLGAMVGLFILVSAAFGDMVAKIPYQIAVVAVLSIVIGNFAGLRQRSYTRMLGYSGIAQIGYALVGLAVGAATQSGFALNTLPHVLTLVVAYGIAALGAFFAADVVKKARPDWDGTIAGMAGYGREHPVTAIAIAVCMFSLTGIPLTVGFWGKLLVFGIAFAANWGWLAWIGIVASVVSFGYYGSVTLSMFFNDAEDGSEQAEESRPVRTTASIVLIVVALAIIVIGILPLFTGLDRIILFFAG